MDEPAGSALPPSDRGTGARRPDAGYPRALRIGISVSVVVHVLGLALYPTVMQREVTGPVPFLLPVSGDPVEGMTVIEIVTVADEQEQERPPEPEEVTPVEEVPASVPGAPDLSDAQGAGLVAPGPTAAERLRPSLGDRRLWAPLDEALNELTVEQRLELELTGRIADWNDSMSAVAEAERALTDWTYTDDDGNKWGVSDGKIHLGGITLPLPFAFGTNPGKRDEVNRRAWEWEEIQRGQASGIVRGSWKDRAEAIRARRDRERAARRDTIPRR